ncbi:MAG TPA: GTPase Era [Gemmatimonadaceae bacterium]|nr:GTPase Era [Gemmatimonadaceae bacterium]
MPRSGFVTLAGLPNAGKSTLLNRLVGEKLAITSPKPQTTRDRIVGIRTDGDVQMVLFDTPGLLEPEHELHARMRARSLRALIDADVIVYVADATRGAPAEFTALVGEDDKRRAPVVLAMNKVDRLTSVSLDTLRAAHPDALFLSAADGTGIGTLIERIAALLPEAPPLYSADELSTQPMRFFVAELVREVALEQLDDEVPHAVSCVVEEYRENRSPVYIRATLFVERASQKRILIGANGARIRELGTAARTRVEALAGTPVYLDLWVKVQPHWRRDPSALDRLGYRPSE